MHRHIVQEIHGRQMKCLLTESSKHVFANLKHVLVKVRHFQRKKIQRQRVTATG